MSTKAFLFLHILGASLFARKGGPLHRQTGMLFVYSMLAMGLGAAVVGLVQNKAAWLGGPMVAYFMITATRTVRRGSREDCDSWPSLSPRRYSSGDSRLSPALAEARGEHQRSRVSSTHSCCSPLRPATHECFDAAPLPAIGGLRGTCGAWARHVFCDGLVLPRPGQGDSNAAARHARAHGPRVPATGLPHLLDVAGSAAP